MMETIIAKWTKIDNLGKMKLSRNSYYWVLILPIVVSLLPRNINEFTLKIGETVFGFSWQLPFKWYLLYLVGVFFGLATLLYEVFCPGFIKLWRNYSDFELSGYPNSYLVVEAEILNLSDNAIIKDFITSEPTVLYLKHKEIERLKTIKKKQGSGIGRHKQQLTNPDIEIFSLTGELAISEDPEKFDFSANMEIHNRCKKEAFDLIFEKVNKVQPFVRTLCTLFYLIGILILAYIFIKNSYYVFDHFNSFQFL